MEITNSCAGICCVQEQHQDSQKLSLGELQLRVVELLEGAG